MSQKIETLCNRCGREIISYDIKISSAKIQLWGVGEYRTGPGQRIDFCEECYERFIAFLEGSV